MWLDWLTGILIIGSLVGFVAMLLGLAWANRRAKQAIAEGREPKFSWAWFIFSIYLLASGIRTYYRECFIEQHKDQEVWVDMLGKGLGIVLLAVGITFFTNQVQWFIHTRRNRE